MTPHDASPDAPPDPSRRVARDAPDTGQNAVRDAGQAGHRLYESLHRDPRFRDLPYKVETTARGKVVMSPPSLYHGSLQFRMATAIHQAHLGGHVVTEAAIRTPDGTRVADVAWFREDHWQEEKQNVQAVRAPAICVEVASPSNSAQEMKDKRDLYLAAGAEEVWLCDADRQIHVFDAHGKRTHSRFLPELPAWEEE
jgi:Uma2 family endonuclease